MKKICAICKKEIDEKDKGLCESCRNELQCIQCKGTGVVKVGSPGHYDIVTCGKCNGKGVMQG
jgi:hypothetical protein